MMGFHSSSQASSESCSLAGSCVGLHRVSQQSGSKKNAALGAYSISWILSCADYTSEAEAEPHYGFLDLLLILQL